MARARGSRASATTSPTARRAAAAFNVLGRPRVDPAVVFSTHFDCVPPFFPSRDRGRARCTARGRCDAKGILVAQVAAAERLRAAGETRGRAAVRRRRGAGQRRREGRQRARRRIAVPDQRRADRQPARRRRRAASTACGCAPLAARRIQSAPELGESAIEKLVDALVALRGLPLPVDPDLGPTFYTVGLIKGGVAPNVIPARAPPS